MSELGLVLVMCVCVRERERVSHELHLQQHFSNFNIYPNHPGMLLNCKFWFSRAFNKPPIDEMHRSHFDYVYFREIDNQIISPAKRICSGTAKDCNLGHEV